MCKEFSFLVTRDGRILDGFGLTDSHSTIREIHGLGANDDTTNAYEWQPPKGWPEADFIDGLVEDAEVFDLQSSHLTNMEHHVRSRYPDLPAWKAHGTFPSFPGTKFPQSIVVREGATLVAPALIEAGNVYLSYRATLVAPALTKAGNVSASDDATLTAPALTEAGSVVVYKGATMTTPMLRKSGEVYIGSRAMWTSPALTEAGGVYIDIGATWVAPALSKVGDATIREGATWTTPALIEAGNVFVNPGATWTAPKLIVVSNVWICSGAILDDATHAAIDKVIRQ